MRFDRLTVYGAMLAVGAVPIFTPLDLEAGRRVITACASAGARVVEVTNRREGTLGVFRGLVAWAAVAHPEVILGAGTVYEAPTTALFLDAGANFIVSPILNPKVARLCNRRRVAYLPGCGSATEISLAEELGAEIIKLFPAAAFDGSAFIRGILGPSPWSKLMPTNIASSEDAVRRWFGSGAACVGVGGSLLTDEAQADPDPERLASRLQEFLGWVRAARG
jgi:2-dehydro-3-deoxyphosphogluconate aldolase/(4S)-4-hydroxy-2-oxoglutarate aldolase